MSEQIDNGLPTPEEMAAYSAAMKREETRRAITSNVGDTPSLLGTISDGAGILVALAFADIVALNDNTTFAAYRTAKLDAYTALANGADIAALATSALAKIQNGDAKLTASVKGLEAVINETLARSTAVAEILTPPVESA